MPAPAPAVVGFCHHLGVLLFSAVLLDLEKQMATGGWLLKQWLATLLLGAVNIEQTKLLDFEDLHRLLGRTLRSLFPQRSQLSELASVATAPQLLSFNGQLVGAPQTRDFYFDPHTKHYTGMQNVLKGWCASIRWADKVLHSDFFHTAAGDPVYLECADNYQDMRERFAALLPRLRQDLGLPAEAVLTCVIDRGIFSQEVFAQAVAAPDYHLITWEKNYRTGQWDPQKRAGQYVLERTRNHAQDKRVYRFEYLDQDWAKNPQMRQLIVRATNPRGRSVEVGVLTDDRQRPAPQIIYLIFNRWTQENDFKYLDAALWHQPNHQLRVGGLRATQGPGGRKADQERRLQSVGTTNRTTQEPTEQALTLPTSISAQVRAADRTDRGADQRPGGGAARTKPKPKKKFRAWRC